MSEIKIVPYGPEWEQAHVEFASQYFTPKRRKRPEYIYWKFRGEPGKELPSFLLAVEDNKRVIGQFGVIPLEIYEDGKIIPAQGACDSMVDVNYRGKGIAQQFYNRFDTYNRLTFGTGFSVPSQKSLMRYGFKVVDGYQEYAIPVSIGKTLGMRFKAFNAISWLRHPQLWLKSKFMNPRKDVKECDFEETVKIFEDYNKTLPGAHTNFDRKWLEWRFQPFKRYNTLPTTYKFIDSSDFFTLLIQNEHCYITNYRFAEVRNAKKAILLSFIEGSKLNASFISVTADPVMEKAIKGLLKIKRRLPSQVLIKPIPGMEAPKFFNFSYFDNDQHL